MSGLRWLYLILALASLLPLARLMLEGLSPPQAVEIVWAFRTGKFLAYDFWVAAGALSVWVVAETAVRKNWSALLAIPATFLVGVGCGLPLYLFLRTRPVD